MSSTVCPSEEIYTAAVESQQNGMVLPIALQQAALTVRLARLHRRWLLRGAVLGVALGLLAAFLLPSRYEATAAFVAEEQSGSMMAKGLMAAASGSGSGMGSAASQLLGSKSENDLYLYLLRSPTLEDELIKNFGLRDVYRERYQADVRKQLERRTDIREDHKSGVISIIVTDRSAQRATDLANAYVEALNHRAAELNNTAAAKECEFLGHRIAEQKQELDASERALSDFSSQHEVPDLKEASRTMLSAAASLKAEQITSNARLQALGQVYGEDSAQLKAARAEVQTLDREMARLDDGSSSSAQSQGRPDSMPSLRSLPILALDYSRLVRQAKIDELVYQFLVQQYEMAKVEQARTTPSVRLVDRAQIPEKRSFPPRTVLVLIGLVMGPLMTLSFLVAREFWRQRPELTFLLHRLRALAS